MVKIYIASFNRASDGAISTLVEKMKNEGIMFPLFFETKKFIEVYRVGT